MTTETKNAWAPGAYGEGMSKAKTAVIVAVLWVCAMVTQSQIDTRRHYYNPILDTPGKGFADSVRNNMFGASMLGVREVAAGMLWVKADELFHEGKYLELVPYFTLVTFMDPHQIDVYSTGAWHLMYNFGDARMVPQGMAFLSEGIRNNPNVWDLYFQKAWSSFDWPNEDYDAALPNFQDAMKHKGTDGSPPPLYISHMVAHCMVRQGNVEGAIAMWRRNILFAEQALAKAKREKDETQIRFLEQERDVCRNNLNLVIVRQAFRKDLPRKPLPLSLELKVRNGGKRILELQCRVVGLPPLMDGGGEPTNARLEFRVQDKDYDKLLAAHRTDFAWIGKNLTRFRSIYNIVEPDGRVMTQKIPWVPLDMSKDNTLEPPRKPEDIWPLTSKEYEIVVRLDPRVRRQPEAVQDKLGWIGEGIAPGEDVIPAANNGRALEKRIIVSREMILGEK